MQQDAQIQYYMSAKTMQTTTTIWPVLCDTSQQLGYYKVKLSMHIL
jgi:hypothetical protein